MVLIQVLKVLANRKIRMCRIFFYMDFFIEYLLEEGIRSLLHQYLQTNLKFITSFLGSRLFSSVSLSSELSVVAALSFVPIDFFKLFSNCEILFHVYEIGY